MWKIYNRVPLHLVALLEKSLSGNATHEVWRFADCCEHIPVILDPWFMRSLILMSLSEVIPLLYFYHESSYFNFTKPVFCLLKLLAKAWTIIYTIIQNNTSTDYNDSLSTWGSSFHISSLTLGGMRWGRSKMRFILEQDGESIFLSADFYGFPI